jgi:hypothetical protein
MSNHPRSFYPGGLTDTPINYWNMWVPFLQSLGINSDNAPRFAPPATPPAGPDTPAQRIRFMAPEMSPYNELASSGAPQSPADLAQAGLQLAQLGQPTQPTWMAQQPQQQMPQGLLSPTGLLGARTDLPSEADRYRGLLAAMNGLGA